MTKHSRLGDHVLYFILLWCVFSFKVLIGGVEEAGLRVDDLLLIVASVVLILRRDLFRIPRSSAMNFYLVYVLINFSSAAWNAKMGRVEFIYSTIFSVRLAEYLEFYYLGYALMESGVDVWRGLRVYFYVLCAVVPLQMIHAIPVANKFNAARASGNTNGPYELAVVAAFFMCYFGYRQQKRPEAGASFAILLLTASRSTLAGTIMSLSWRQLKGRMKKLNLLVVGSAMLLATVIASVIILPPLCGNTALLPSGVTANSSTQGSVRARFQSAVTLVSSEDVHDLLFTDPLPVYQNSQDYISGMFIESLTLAVDVDADRSGTLRIFRWASLIKSAMAHSDSIMIGMGPSFGSAAVDGNFVRIFIETGVIGLLVFLIFLRSLMQGKNDRSGAFREFVLILVITACFIDIFTSYKTMLLFWLWHGMNEYEARQRSNASSLSNAG
jgi:hypothetical protein